MKRHLFMTMRLSAVCLGLALAQTSFVSCSDSDDDVPVIPVPPVPAVPVAQTFGGEQTTTLPSMPSFEAVKCDNAVTVTWANPEQTVATVQLGAFKIAMQTPMGERAYDIGEMNIDVVSCTHADGKITLSKPEFECQAGNFATSGSLTGELVDGTLTLTLVYKPGSMPFEVQSVFVGR